MDFRDFLGRVLFIALILAAIGVIAVSSVSVWVFLYFTGII